MRSSLIRLRSFNVSATTYLNHKLGWVGRFIGRVVTSQELDLPGNRRGTGIAAQAICKRLVFKKVRPWPAGALGEGDTFIDRQERGDHMRGCKFQYHVPKTVLAEAEAAPHEVKDFAVGRPTPVLRTYP